MPLARLAALAAPLACLAAASADTFALRARTMVAPDGTLKENASVMFRDGQIVQVGDVPAGTRTVDYGDAVLCPGLIDIGAALGAVGQLGERAGPLEPGVIASDAFDRASRQMREALEAGVTTFVLSPADNNLVGGVGVICQTGGPDGPRTLDMAGPLKLSLSAEVYEPVGNFPREPTSRSGAIGMLRDALRSARAAGDDANPLAVFASGRRRALVTAPTAADVLALAPLAAEYRLKVVFEHSQDAGDVAPVLRDVDAGVVTGPIDLNSSRRSATAPAVFEQAGVPVAIAGGLPLRPASGLRIGAAVAARHGLSAAAARRAITSTPASLLGAESLGAIERGRQADVVVFSGDPLDLRSRVLAVYVGGVLIHAADD